MEELITGITQIKEPITSLDHDHGCKKAWVRRIAESVQLGIYKRRLIYFNRTPTIFINFIIVDMMISLR